MKPGGRLLWVEDQVGTIKGTLRRLRRHGYDVVVCETASDALVELESSVFERVIVDYQIPKSIGESAQKGVGLELVRRIIEAGSAYSIPPNHVMLLTAQMATFRRQLELSEAEGFAVIEKPGSLPRIEEWLEIEGAAA
jgi:CheY-like chemotaxis protein